MLQTIPIPYSITGTCDTKAVGIIRGVSFVKDGRKINEIGRDLTIVTFRVYPLVSKNGVEGNRGLSLDDKVSDGYWFHPSNLK